MNNNRATWLAILSCSIWGCADEEFTDPSIETQQTPLVVTQTATKICQLSGLQDRDLIVSRPTATQLAGGVNGKLTGTDLGFPFEYGNRLYFMFGDSNEQSVDRCEPFFCGSTDAPTPKPIVPRPASLSFWKSTADYSSFGTIHGASWESMASASLGVDPNNCFPLQVVTESRQSNFMYPLVSNTVGAALRTNGPLMAMLPQDRFVFAMGSRMIVVTSSGQVFAHQLSGTTVGTGYPLSMQALVASRPEDKWVLPYGDHLLVITNTGRIFGHRVNGNTVEAAHELYTPNAIATQPGDKWLGVMGNRLVLLTTSGEVWVHPIVPTSPDPYLLAPYRLGGYWPVATHAGDRPIVANSSRLLVQRADGHMFYHDIVGNNVGVPYELGGSTVELGQRPPVVANGSLVSFWSDTGAFRPTRLDGAPLGRSEGGVSAFGDATSMYAFFTKRDRPLGCPPGRTEGCAHDDNEPGGQLVFAQSTDGGRNFQERMLFSNTKFLFATPTVQQAQIAPGLPAEAGTGDVVFAFGTGRENNATAGPFDCHRGLPGDVKCWNNSFPFLTVAPLASAGAQNGAVYVTPTYGMSHLYAPTRVMGALVAARPEDLYATALGSDLIVVNRAGRAFRHSMSFDIGAPVSMGTATVRTDTKWFLASDLGLVTVSGQGIVTTHAVVNGVLQPGVQQGVAPVQSSTAHVTVLGTRLLIAAANGSTVSLSLTGTGLGPVVALTGSLGNQPGDKHVLASAGELRVVNANGTVQRQTLVGNVLGPRVAMTGTLVGNRPEDRWVLSSGTAILTIVKQPWRYLAGVVGGQPQWSEDEQFAAPLDPFGRERSDEHFHECLGYFSVRYQANLGKWVMLYTCNTQFNANNGPRGIYVRSASRPWGPWSEPTRMFDPDNAYCNYMSRGDCGPFEEAVRRDDGTSIVRAAGGEYAPFLLPPRYTRQTGADTTLFFTMSTYHPYQVNLMKFTVTGL